MLLAQKMHEEGWRKQCEEYIKKSVDTIVETVGLDGHVRAADELVAAGILLARDLRNPALDGKVLRSRAETYRTTVEALNIATRLARDVRGIRLGQPSTEGADDRDVSVIYNVKVQRPADLEKGEKVVNE
jgi:hypothetical protein